jgi:hypothetical protein
LLGDGEGFWLLLERDWEDAGEGEGARKAVMSAWCWFNGKRAEGVERRHGWLEWRKALRTGIPGVEVG